MQGRILGPAFIVYVFVFFDGAVSLSHGLSGRTVSSCIACLRCKFQILKSVMDLPGFRLGQFTEGLCYLSLNVCFELNGKV